MDETLVKISELAAEVLRCQARERELLAANNRTLEEKRAINADLERSRRQYRRLCEFIILGSDGLHEYDIVERVEYLRFASDAYARLHRFAFSAGLDLAGFPVPEE